MKKIKFLLPVFALSLSFLHAGAALALDPRELFVQSKAYFKELDESRRGRDVASFQAQEAGKQSMVDQKNMAQLMADAPPQEFGMQEAMLLAAAAPPQQVGYSGGSTYPFIYFDPRVQGRGFALSDSSGIYRTDNGGTNWYAVNNGLANLTVASLAVAPSNSSILYAGTVAGLHRSVDGGLNWTHLTNTQTSIPFKRLSNYRSIAVDFANPNRVYAASSLGQVFLSTNGGANFTQLGNLNIGATPVSAIHLARNGRLFAGSTRGLMQWTGAAWQKITLASDNVLDIVSTFTGGVETIHVTNGNRIARTSQTGVPTAWTYSTAIPLYNGATQPGHINRLAIRVVGGQTQILATQQREWGGRVYYSANNGASWTNVGNNNFVNDLAINPTRAWKPGGRALFLSAAFDPFNVNKFVITDDWGIWTSTNSGGQWRETVSGTPNIIGTDLVRDPRTGTYLLASMDNGLTEYNPATGAVTAVFPRAGTNALYNGHVWSVVVLPNGNRVVSIAPWNDVKNSIVIIRPDGSTAFATGLPAGYPRSNTVWQQGYIRAIVVDPKNPNRLFLTLDGDGQGVYTSTNGGFHWAKTFTQPGNLRAYRLAIDPVDTQRLYYGTMWSGGSNGGLYRSWDGGRTWAKSFSGSSNIGDIVVAPDRTVYMGTENTGAPALYVSRDRGVTFSLLKRFDVVGTTPGPIQAITIDPNNPRRMAVSSRKWGDFTGARVYATDDGGTTWTDISAGLPNTSGAAKMTFSQDGRSLYLVMNAGTLFQIPLA